LFYENGPWNFDSDGKSLVSNPHSWNENANLVYVDQPIGTGFSKADDGSVMDTNEEEIADNMAQFMIHFLEKFPQLKHKDFYITGESYAGHYIPAISHNFLLDVSFQSLLSWEILLNSTSMILDNHALTHLYATISNQLTTLCSTLASKIFLVYQEENGKSVP